MAQSAKATMPNVKISKGALKRKRRDEQREEESRNASKRTKRVIVSPQLPRPRRSLKTMQIDSATPAVAAAGSTESRLRENVDLLQKIWVRNRNQMRGQGWFKQLGILRSALRSLLETMIEFEILSTSSMGVQDADEVRARFENESTLRSEKERLEEWIREDLVPESYVAFTQLVANTQFGHLGVVLVAVVTEVAGLIGAPRRVVPDQIGVLRREEVKNGLGSVAGMGVAKEVVGMRVVVTGLGKGESEEQSYALVREDGVDDDDGDDDDNDDMGEAVARIEMNAEVSDEKEEAGSGAETDMGEVGQRRVDARKPNDNQHPHSKLEEDDIVMHDTTQPRSHVKTHRSLLNANAMAESVALSEQELTDAATTAAIQTANTPMEVTMQKQPGKREPLTRAAARATVTKSAKEEGSKKRTKDKDKGKTNKSKNKGRNVIDDLFAGF